MTDLKESTECTRLCLLSSLAKGNNESLDFITNERLTRPPFPFIHTIIKICVAQPEESSQPHQLFAEGLYNAYELDIKCISASRKDKIRFLFKMLLCVARITGERVDVTVSPMKMLSGQEVVSTHLFLRCLARASNVESDVSKRVVEEILQNDEGTSYKRSVQARNSFIKLQAIARGNVVRRELALQNKRDSGTKDKGGKNVNDNQLQLMSQNHDGMMKIEDKLGHEVQESLTGKEKEVVPISPDDDGETRNVLHGKVQNQHNICDMDHVQGTCNRNRNTPPKVMIDKFTQTSKEKNTNSKYRKRKTKVHKRDGHSPTLQHENKGKAPKKVLHGNDRSPRSDKSDGTINPIEIIPNTNMVGIKIKVQPTVENPIDEVGTPKKSNCKTEREHTKSEVLSETIESLKQGGATDVHYDLKADQMKSKISTSIGELNDVGESSDGNFNPARAQKRVRKMKIINGVKTRQEISISNDQHCEQQADSKSHGIEPDIHQLQIDVKKRLRRMKEKEAKLDRRMEETEQRYEHLKIQEDRCKKLAENLRKQQQRVKQEGVRQSIEMDKLRLQIPQSRGDHFHEKTEPVHFSRELHFGPELLQQASENATITDLRLSLERRERSLIRRQAKMAKAERKLRARILELEGGTLGTESHATKRHTEKRKNISDACTRATTKCNEMHDNLSQAPESDLEVDEDSSNNRSLASKSSGDEQLLRDNSKMGDEENVVISPVSHVMIEAMDHNLTTITEESDERQILQSHQSSTLPRSLMDYTYRYIEAERQTFRVLQRAQSF